MVIPYTIFIWEGKISAQGKLTLNTARYNQNQLGGQEDQLQREYQNIHNILDYNSFKYLDWLIIISNMAISLNGMEYKYWSKPVKFGTELLLRLSW